MSKDDFRISSWYMYAVWGGDPVYPTINYEQDPDCVADFRHANMHEPTPDILDQLRDVSRAQLFSNLILSQFVDRSCITFLAVVTMICRALCKFK